MGNNCESIEQCVKETNNQFNEVLEHKNDMKEVFDEKYKRSVYKSLKTVKTAYDFVFGKIDVVKSIDGNLLMRKRFLYKKLSQFEISLESKMVRMQFHSKYFIK